MENPANDFSKVRVWGTIGWITAGLVISFVFAWDSEQLIASGALKNTFMMASVASFTLGIYSFSLPSTPPSASTGKVSLRTMLGLDALNLFKDRNYALFFIASILICIPLAFYYQNTNLFLSEIGVTNPTGKMTIGQISEVLFMLLLPFFFTRYGFKKTLLLGMLAWGVRYLLFAFGDAGSGVYMLLIGIALHGICYDFFFVSGQIYTDNRAGEKYKSSAQGLITLATYGFGMLIGFWIAGKIGDAYVTADGHNWQTIWMYPAGFAFVVFVFFLLTFKEPKKMTES
jgi:nucleoside transporter